ADPQRLSRLLIAACLAYIWIVYLGSLGKKDGWREIIHRKKRCDLRLFQLGLGLLDHFLTEDLPIPVQFHFIIYPKQVYACEVLSCNVVMLGALSWNAMPIEDAGKLVIVLLAPSTIPVKSPPSPAKGFTSVKSQTIATA